MIYADTFPWARSTQERTKLLNGGAIGNINAMDFVNSIYQDTLSQVPSLSGESKYESRMREMMYLNLNWFMTTLLDRKDRMSMASGLEVRVPFCDHRIVEYAFNIPWSIKLLGQREKGLVREALSNDLPTDIVYRKKSPYPKTHNQNYLVAARDLVSKIISDKTSPILQIIELNKIKELIETNGESFNKPWFGQLMTNAQLFAFLIQLDFWLSEYKIQIV